MRKFPVPAAIGLMVIIAGLRASASADEPPRDKLRDYLRDAWFRSDLRVMKEPDLWQLAAKDRNTTVYRFNWWPSFHDPVAVRFVKNDDGAVVYAVKVRLNEQANWRVERVVAQGNPGEAGPLGTDRPSDFEGPILGVADRAAVTPR